MPVAVQKKRTFTIGSRKSPLAKVQSYHVRDLLAKAFPDETFDMAFKETGGDKNQSEALYLLGGKALWTEELEDALVQGEIDMIVHSLKDVPTNFPDGCEMGAIVERESPRDSLVVKAGLEYKSLEELPAGSVVGTSSVRRVAQLRRAFPELVFADVRGNLQTRLAKLDDPAGPYTAIVIARAGFERMKLDARITCDIVPPTLYHAVGQGALGVEIRSSDIRMKEMLSVVSHRDTEIRCRAERACLRVLEGGCSVPVGVESCISRSSEHNGSEFDSVVTLTLTGSVTSLSGKDHVVHMHSMTIQNYDDADACGATVGRHLIANGARAILDEINIHRDAKKAADSDKLKVAQDLLAKSRAEIAAANAAAKDLAASTSDEPHGLPASAAPTDTAGIANAAAAAMAAVSQEAESSSAASSSSVPSSQPAHTSYHTSLSPIASTSSSSLSPSSLRAHVYARPTLNLPSSHPPLEVVLANGEICLRPEKLDEAQSFDEQLEAFFGTREEGSAVGATHALSPVPLVSSSSAAAAHGVKRKTESSQDEKESEQDVASPPIPKRLREMQG